MRICIELNTTKIPLNYNYLILSLIKNNLSKENPLLFKKIYEKNEDYEFRTKPFTFSVKLEDFKITGDEVKLENHIFLTISTCDYIIGSVIYNSFLKEKIYEYQNKYKLEIGNVNILKEKNINSNQVVFKTLSPIIIRNKAGEFLSIDDSNYEKELNYIVDNNIKSYRGNGLKEELKFQPVLMKKRVIKEKISEFTEKTGKEIFYITGYDGIFKLTGDKEDLNLIYKMGVGFRRSSGGGCLEIV
ncbi:CRISPR associated protein Cas6 [Clostridium saccharobutylicum]|uniref:CRISPR-associated endoribonuclease Cas6 n=1 Tax=Clostridium saccharobutylicum TaxID=169679 RepID=UPI000983E5C2|nr:CRISPR-associated endoribonuclease Cas6 [Clostridium saccharobutylicum]AQS10333.1 CRISPR associated protein Cas6 [Clostridium saccharobutylicum]MBC2438704.1 CRISPR-associated endoribonuclease Cas6 [Clostridium saccharobutylicum]NSB87730.1 CRISPR-associated endoribonuclease Cas6 [Clostridium saccharobutylicum]NYC31272.1 CRISPR-associated endoribonuclease Cas6 [Clostridium saccharobutylicum]OOM19195.1 CRISPR associated protein Cas6 [Clostridium saccharobutylicum]